MASHMSTSSGSSQLATLNSVKIKQTNGVFTIKNKYAVVTPSGEEIMYAREDSSMLGAMLAGNNRPFHMDVVDQHNREVFTLRRPFTFGLEKMDVMMGGRLVAVVRKEMTFFKPVFHINNAQDYTVYKVKGPVHLSGAADFDIYDRDKRQVGTIQKKWGGFGKEMFTDKDNFRIVFPANSDVSYKAAFIGTSFLIDFLFYEN